MQEYTKIISQGHKIKKWSMKGESKDVWESMKAERKKLVKTEQLGKHSRGLEQIKADSAT